MTTEPEPWDIWKGHRVRLRAFEPGDWERYHRDAGDSQSARENDVTHFPRSAEAARKWAEGLATETPTDGSYRWAIEALADGTLAGMVSTSHVVERMGTFSYGLGVFRDQRRRGYASEAVLLVLRYYFEELRFEKANAIVYAFNDASLALHRSLGFVEEGRIRSAVFTGGQHYDEVCFGMTADEFRQRLGDTLSRGL